MAYVSTGRLPPSEAVGDLVTEAHRRFAHVDDGEPSSVYPALATVPRDLYGVAVAATDGRVFAAGHSDTPFALMSVAKPFVFALVCDVLGAEAVREIIGVNPTGRPFDSLDAVDSGGDGRTNPMVNAGAIATAALAPGADPAARWEFVRAGLSRFAGRELRVADDLFASASATNLRNRALTQLLASKGLLRDDPAVALDRYTRQSCLLVTATDLAVMGATLADGGVHPRTGEAVVSADSCRHTLAVMITAGLYETSGDWLYDVGLPAKSGIGGGIVTVAPGKGALGTFAPPLDAAGNSVRGRLCARFLSAELGLDLLASAPQR